jgi:hypothetical protein
VRGRERETGSGRMRTLHGKPGNRGEGCTVHIRGMYATPVRGVLTPGGQMSCTTLRAPTGSAWGGDCRALSSVSSYGRHSSPIIFPHASRARHHSPFFRGRHGIDISSEEVVVPRDRADSEGSGADGEGVRLPGRRNFLGCGAGG